jgi:phage shock protein A
MSQPSQAQPDALQSAELNFVQSLQQLGVQINGSLANGQALAAVFRLAQDAVNLYQSEIQKVLEKVKVLEESLGAVQRRLAEIEKGKAPAKPADPRSP